MPSIAHLLNKQVSIKREENIDTGGGSFSTSMVETGAPVMARRSSPSGGDRRVAGELAAQVTHTWFFDVGVDVKIRDEIHYGEFKYDVLVVANPSQDDWVKVLTREVQVGAVEN